MRSIRPRSSRPTGWRYYSRQFFTVEVNNAFYRLPEARVFARWAEQVPDGFVMAVKASRYLTHIKRLKDPSEPVQRLMTRARALGPKLGPVLLQLPPTLPAHLEDLAATLDAFDAETRVAVEFRHPSWFSDETAAMLAARNVALCLADSPQRKTPCWRTASWGYLRMHEGRASPRPCYGRQALRSWADRVRDLWRPEEDVFVYFNNDPGACAVRNASTFTRIFEHATR